MSPLPSINSRIVRNKKRFYAGLILTVVLLAMIVFVWAFSTMPGTIAFIFSLFPGVGLIYAFMIVGLSGVGHCPDCAHPMTNLGMVQNAPTACRACGAYLESTDGTLRVTSSESIDDNAIFDVPLPVGETHWPDGCCVCGDPATRSIEVEVEYTQDASLGSSVAVGALSVGTLKAVKKGTIRIGVPHCSVHDDGAKVEFSLRHQLPYLSFRAKKYADEFARQNPPPAAWLSHQA